MRRRAKPGEPEHEWHAFNSKQEAIAFFKLPTWGLLPRRSPNFEFNYPGQPGGRNPTCNPNKQFPEGQAKRKPGRPFKKRVVVKKNDGEFNIDSDGRVSERITRGGMSSSLRVAVDDAAERLAVVKAEKAEALLEVKDQQELVGQLVQSENAKMTTIDKLKSALARAEAELALKDTANRELRDRVAQLEAAEASLLTAPLPTKKRKKDKR